MAADGHSSLPLRSAMIGRDSEIEALRDCVRRGKSLHLHGPAGAGKSALLDHLYRTWGEIDASRVPIYCKKSSTMREIVVCITEALLSRSGPLAGSDKYLEPIEIASTPDIRTNNSRDLRNIIAPYLSKGDYCIILDHLEHLTPKINAFLYALRERASIITANRQSWTIGDSFTGNLAYDLWLVPKLKVGNLQRKDAFRLMESLYENLNMKLSGKAGFFRDVFHITQGNPKMTEAILQKARRPEYIVDGKLNLNLIVIDCMIDEVHVP